MAEHVVMENGHRPSFTALALIVNLEYYPLGSLWKYTRAEGGVHSKVQAEGIPPERAQ